MPKGINPIKKLKVKQGLLSGKSAKDSVLEAGYSKSSANNATALSSVKQCQDEIRKELLAKDITADLIISRLNEDRTLAIKKRDYATATRCDELLGKFIALFREHQVVEQSIPDSDKLLSKLRNIHIN